MSIGKKAGKGFLSLLYRGLLEKLMGLGAMYVLARQLSPYDFGLVSITEALLVLISVIGTTGLPEFLLAYRQQDTEEIFRSAFWFNVVISLVILALFIMVLPVWAYYQGDARIINIGIISGLIFITSQLQMLPKTWLNKNLMFDTLVKLQAPFIIIVPVAKILAVYMGFGVYSLILPTLLLQPVLTFILYRVTKIYPGWKLYKNRWKEIYGFTKHLIGGTILSRIADQGDKIILAKFLGLEKLGIYNIAVQMAELFVTQLTMFSNNILSSVLPKYVDDKDTFYRHYTGFLKTFAFFVFPVLAIMFLSAKPLILFLYGPKWEAAILPMQILLVYSAFRAVTSSYGSVMNSFHLNRKSFTVMLFYTPAHLTGSVIGSFFGVPGVAVSVLLVRTIFINWNIKQVMDAVARPFTAWYNNMAPYFIATAAIASPVALLLYNTSVISHTHYLVQIAITGAVFAVLYILFFRITFSKELNKISSFMGFTFPKAQHYFNLVFRV